MINIVLDAGTTWSKIIETNNSDKMSRYKSCLVKEENGKKYYIIPSSKLPDIDFKFDKATGHMTQNLIPSDKDYENEIIALVQGFRKKVKEDAIILDLGSRDSKWVKYTDGKFKDLDWNSACSSSTGATIEMLLKFYNLSSKDLSFVNEKYVITCGIFGLEKIMDDIAKGGSPKIAVSKFVHGIAHNAWNFAKKPEKLYLSGGFCKNQCFINSLSKYTEIVTLGRFLLAEGLLD
ncbi:MAG: hypothetical protein PHV37_08575 [Candidatus Gastranaerophilales bacterium]|nr:hypothetical protein [Candidatus Gastranaerophilales bacterium]